MIFPHAAKTVKSGAFALAPPSGRGDTHVGVLRVIGRTSRVYARPTAGFPPLLTLPQHIYYSTFRPKRKGFSFIIIVFCFGRGEMLFSVKADAFGSAAKQFKQHG